METDSVFESNSTTKFTFNFEKTFDTATMTQIFNDKLYLPYIFAATYLVSVFTGKQLMKDKEPFKLKECLILWNVLLCVFSAFGSWRILPGLFQVTWQHGLHYSICNRGDNLENAVIGCWLCFFTVSKVFELLDTAFIVTRKGQLSFLHWFHHAATLIVTWHGFAELISLCRWYTGMNFAIHTIMYGYYALTAAKIKIPRFIAKCITVSQITQMVIGAVVSLVSWVTLLNGKKCDISIGLSFAFVCIYGIYFYLFLKFFLASYVKGQKIKSK